MEDTCGSETFVNWTTYTLSVEVFNYYNVQVVGTHKHDYQQM